MYTKITYSAAIATKVKDLRIGKKKTGTKTKKIFHKNEKVIVN